MSSNKVIIVSELYYPEENATGFILTKIAEGLTKWFSVSVICGQPNYFSKGIRGLSEEIHNGVHIRRCWSTTYNKDNVLLRIINGITVSLSIFVNLLIQSKRGDIILVVTNPPLLPFIALFVNKLKKTSCILLIHDVYPEVLIVTEMLSKKSFLSRLLSAFTTILYNNVDKIVVLGRDMQELVALKLNNNVDKIVVIPNWADIDIIHPVPRTENELLKELNLMESFVFLYAGNMGRTHGLEPLIKCAEELSNENISFLFIGDGAKKQWIEECKKKGNLKNIIVLPPRPRNEQKIFLNACNIAIISFIPNMSGISVPSRMYNIMAAGKPILAVADINSELARVVLEEQTGYVIKADETENLSRKIKKIAGDAAALVDMGNRAYDVAKTKYPFTRIIENYRVTIDSVFESQQRN